MKKQKIIRKSKIGWVVTSNTIIAFDRIQATLYHVFESANKKPLIDMRKEVLRSKPDELNTWVDVISLAQGKGLVGYGTRLRREWFEES